MPDLKGATRKARRSYMQFVRDLAVALGPRCEGCTDFFSLARNYPGLARKLLASAHAFMANHGLGVHRFT